jgi:cobaltochelatase CobN
VGIVIWATSTMRTRGDDVAEVLYLMGLRPIWHPGTGRVDDVEVIPTTELRFPRVDVTIRSSGLFRDTFPNLMSLIDRGVRMIAALDEPDGSNFLARNVRVETNELVLSGVSPEDARRRAEFRVFSDKPGCYGAGVDVLLDAGKWTTTEDLGRTYIDWGGYAYGSDNYGAREPAAFHKRMSKLDVTLKNEDSREMDILISDDYNAYFGGMNAAVKHAAGKYPRSYTGDSSDPRKPRLRATDEEGRFIFRARLLNPKWIEGLKRHGYKGAGDLSRAVDICFQWDATSKLLEDWQYAELAQTYAFQPEMQEFFREHNVQALHNISERLLEAIRRGLWENPGDATERLEELFLSTEGDIEEALVSDETAETARGGS